MSHDLFPDDLWRFIGFKLDSPADRIRCRAVSKSWASLLREPPWLMLSESDNEAEEQYQENQNKSGFDPNYNSEEDEQQPDDDVIIPPRGFVRLGEQQIHNIDLPANHRARCVGSKGNWLISIHYDTSIRLLNPFSKVEFFLPSARSFEYDLHHMMQEPPERRLPRKWVRDGFVWKIVLSSSPLDGDCVAMAIHHYWFILGMARPGDASWTTVHTADAPLHKHMYIVDAVFYKQRFYAVDCRGRLVVCDIEEEPPTMSYLTTDGVYETKDEGKIYLVECSGELLMVHKHFEEFEESEDPCRYSTCWFDIYKFDFVDMKFDKINSLGEYSLFLGFNTSVSVLASDYFGLIKKNCIYFTDDYIYGYRGNSIPGGHDMGVFDLEEETIAPHYEGDSTSYYSPPVWIVPT